MAKREQERKKPAKIMEYEKYKGKYVMVKRERLKELERIELKYMAMMGYKIMKGL